MGSHIYEDINSSSRKTSFQTNLNCGRVIRVLITGAEGPGVQNTACARDQSKALSVHPAVNGYPALSRAGESERR